MEDHLPTDVQVHPTAIVDSDEVGAGTRIWAYVHVMEGAVIGRDCKVGDHAYIEGGATLGDRVTIKNGSMIWHGVSIGNDVFVGPGVVFTNDLFPRVRYQTGPTDWIATVVEDRVSIGANCTIVCGIRIGANSMIGAGSVVTADVDDHALMTGDPARRTGWACDCGRPLSDELGCGSCGRRYAQGPGGLKEIES